MKIRNLITSTALAGLMVIVPCVIASEEEQAGSTGTVKVNCSTWPVTPTMARAERNTPIAQRHASRWACRVGLKGEDGKTYLLIGDHKPLNKGVCPVCGEDNHRERKNRLRDGINMIENAEVVK